MNPSYLIFFHIVIIYVSILCLCWRNIFCLFIDYCPSHHFFLSSAIIYHFPQPFSPHHYSRVLDSTISDERASKRIKLPCDKLGQQNPLGTVGQFVIVGQKDLAGFSSQESLLYVRDETVELWSALNDTRGNHLSVDGPPGTGKSTET